MIKETIIGIDLGTTNSLVASVDAGIPVVLADRDGERLLPSVVSFDKANNSLMVGQKAKRAAHLNPNSTFSSIKRFMGRRSNEISEKEILNTPFDLILEGNKPVSIMTPDGPRLPEEISSEIIRTLLETSKTRLEQKISKAVITVPAYFNDAQRLATQKAGELAGLEIERIINEPTAAALAYGIDKTHSNAHVAVYDLGGGTFDISILKLDDGVFQVLSTSGNTKLGGDDIDMAIATWVENQIKKQQPSFHLNTESTRKIFGAAEEAKIKLTKAESTTIALPFLDGTNSYEFQLERHTLEKIALPIIKRTKEHCLRALKDAELSTADLDQVILVGGQTRMPLIQQFVKETFDCQEFEESKGSLRVGNDPHKPSGPILNTSTHPDEAIALGASIQAAILSGALEDLILMDVTPLSLGIETFGGLMNVIIPRNTTIPVKAGEMFTNALDYQKSMSIRILQGEREKADDNWELGKLIIDFDPMPKALARVGIQFEIDSNGILNVLARNTKTGEEKILKISSAVDVDDSDVQKMVEESVENAFSDLEYRQWVESKARAEQTLQASMTAIESFGTKMEPEDFESIQQSISDVKKILSQENPETQTGDTQELKQILNLLDQQTAPLADLMMEAISEEWLKKQGIIE